MAEKNPKKTKTQSDYLSDSDSSEEEVSQHLRTSQEERLYSTVKNEDHQNSQRLRNSLKDRHRIK